MKRLSSLLAPVALLVGSLACGGGLSTAGDPLPHAPELGPTSFEGPLAVVDGHQLDGASVHAFFRVAQAMAGVPLTEPDRAAFRAFVIADFEADPTRLLARLPQMVKVDRQLQAAPDAAARAAIADPLYANLLQNTVRDHLLVTAGGALPTDPHAMAALTERARSTWDAHIVQKARTGDPVGIVLYRRPPDERTFQAAVVEIHRMNLNQRIVMPAYLQGMQQTRAGIERSGSLTAAEIEEHGALLACGTNPDCTSEIRVEVDEHGNTVQQTVVNDVVVGDPD